MTATILTPAENRFLQLTNPALALPELTRILPQLREHPTVKVTSDFLTQRAKENLVANRVDWLLAASAAWKLLARLPYAVNPSSKRQAWQHCALCHLPVRYEYHVVLRATGQEILVGSECVKKFMSDEMQYLMALTTDYNFHAVAQYDALTDQYPTVPEILWRQDALPDLPQVSHAQHRAVRRDTQSTVTGYLRQQTTQLPDKRLMPLVKTYTHLQQLNQRANLKAQQRLIDQQKHRQLTAQRAQRAAWQAADVAQETAEQRLRASQPYQRWLKQVATLIVQHLDLGAFKQQLAKMTSPAAVQAVVNRYQLGVLAGEFNQTGHITGQRLQIVPRYLVADLDRFSRQLAKQRQRDWDDDVFNAAVGFDWSAEQRQQQLKQLAQTWEGHQIPAACYAELVGLRATLAAGQPVPTTWPKPLRLAMQRRLAAQPQTGWQPARKNHITPRQVRHLVAKYPDLTTLWTHFERLYALPEAQLAVTRSALNQYYWQQRDVAMAQTTATQRLLAELNQVD